MLNIIKCYPKVYVRTGVYNLMFLICWLEVEVSAIPNLWSLFIYLLLKSPESGNCQFPYLAHKLELQPNIRKSFSEMELDFNHMWVNDAVRCSFQVCPQVIRKAFGVLWRYLIIISFKASSTLEDKSVLAKLVLKGRCSFNLT